MNNPGMTHRSGEDYPTLAYSATDQDPNYRYFEPQPTPLPPADDTHTTERPAMIANPRTLTGGLVVSAAAIALATWLLVWLTNAILAKIPPTSPWSRPFIDVDTAVIAAVAAVITAAALLLLLVAIVEPPRTYYTWIATLLALVGLAAIYTAATAPDGNWRPAIAPLIVAAIVELSVILAVGSVGSRSAGTLRTITERDTASYR